ncbi:MAG TPA: hypothetical protein VF773_16800 [Verrucomicrobiae bacterium]
MLLQISYSKEYGWHVGRAFIWLGLMIVGIPLAFLAVLAEGLLTALLRFPVPIAIGVPILFALLLRARLKKKLNGEPFLVTLPEFFMDDMEAWVIYRGHKHFRALCLLECAIWGSVILSQLAIIAVFYLSTYPFLKRLLVPAL